MSSKRAHESALFLDRVRLKLGDLLGSAATRTSEGAGRLLEAARDLRQGSSLLLQALAARERGNLEAAFFLLQEAWHTEQGTPGVATAFWDVSVALGRAPEATHAAVSLVERCAEEGALELGLQYLAELGEAVPDAIVKPRAVARLLPALRERIDKAHEEERAEAEALLRHALGVALDPQNETPSPGLALYLFAEARTVHADAARRLAELALASPDLHEAKRALLCDFLGRPPGPPAGAPRLDPPERSAPASAPAPRGDRPPPKPTSEGPGGEKPATRARRAEPPQDPPVASPRPASPAERRLLEGLPERFDDDALVFRQQDGRTSRIRWRNIQAVAVARIEAPGRETVTLIDLVLNWIRRSREPLLVVRLRDDGFDPARFVSSGEHSLADFLAEVLERSRAIPLPDPESALGLRPTIFDSVDAYELSILAGRREAEGEGAK